MFVAFPSLAMFLLDPTVDQGPLDRAGRRQHRQRFFEWEAGHDQVPAAARLFIKDDLRLAGQGRCELLPEEPEIREGGSIPPRFAQ